MPSLTTHLAPHLNGLHSQANGTHEGNGKELSAEARDAMIRRAKDILAGRTTPPELEPPQFVLDWFQKEFAGYNPPPTPEAMRDLIEHATLQAHFRGVPIAACRVDGKIAVLAVGNEEIRALLTVLVDPEAPRVVILDTDPY